MRPDDADRLSLTAQQLWDQLESHCCRKTVGSVFVLYRQLFDTRLRSAQGVDAHLANMQHLRSQLELLGALDGRTSEVMALLLSVPHEEDKRWEMFILRYQFSSSEVMPTWDEACAAIRAEADRQLASNRTATAATTATPAAAAAAPVIGSHESGTARRPRSGGSRQHCTHCNKHSHTNSSCWILHPEKRRRKQQQTQPQTQPQMEYAYGATVSFFDGTEPVRRDEGC